jgi:hypothetical protein
MSEVKLAAIFDTSTGEAAELAANEAAQAEIASGRLSGLIPVQVP